MKYIIFISLLFWIDYFLSRAIVDQHDLIGKNFFDYSGDIELNAAQADIVRGKNKKRLLYDFAILLIFYLVLLQVSVTVFMFLAGFYIFPLTYTLTNQIKYLAQIRGMTKSLIQGHIKYDRQQVFIMAMSGTAAFILAALFIVEMNVYVCGGFCGLMSLLMVFAIKAHKNNSKDCDKPSRPMI